MRVFLIPDQRKCVTSCEFLGFNSVAVEVSVLVGYGATSLGVVCMTFQDSMMVSSSRVKISISSLDILTVEDETTMLSENIRQLSITDLR
jgi:hypothetical protein